MFSLVDKIVMISGSQEPNPIFPLEAMVQYLLMQLFLWLNRISPPQKYISSLYLFVSPCLTDHMFDGIDGLDLQVGNHFLSESGRIILLTASF